MAYLELNFKSKMRLWIEGNFPAPHTSHLVFTVLKKVEKEHDIVNSNPALDVGNKRSHKEAKSEWIHLYLCWRLQATLFWTLNGGGNLSGKAQRRRAQVQTCLFTLISLCQGRGQGAVPHQGAGGGEIGMQPRNARHSAQTE